MTINHNNKFVNYNNNNINNSFNNNCINNKLDDLLNIREINKKIGEENKNMLD